MSSLEDQVLECIETTYECKYTRTLQVDVTPIDNCNKLSDYTLKLFLHNPHFGAVVIRTQASSDEEFLNYVKKELQDRQLTRSQQYKLIIYGNNDSEEGF